MTIEQQIEKEVKEVTRYHWGGGLTFTPYLASTILGDGQRLAFICPINSRPYYWLIRVDTNQNMEDFEEMLCAIEEEVPPLFEKDEDTGEEIENEYPAIDWDGGAWGFCED